MFALTFPRRSLPGPGSTGSCQFGKKNLKGGTTFPGGQPQHTVIEEFWVLCRMCLWGSNKILQVPHVGGSPQNMRMSILRFQYEKRSQRSQKSSQRRGISKSKDHSAMWAIFAHFYMNRFRAFTHPGNICHYFHYSSGTNCFLRCPALLLQTFKIVTDVSACLQVLKFHCM